MTYEKEHMRGLNSSVFTDLYKLVNGMKNVEKWVLFQSIYVVNN
jgi:hypothetical protein